MPYSPGVSAFQRNTFITGTYNNGLSMYSGSDPASYFPFVVKDILDNQVPLSYAYSDTLTQRLTHGSDAYVSDSPVSQWTPAQQSIYGKIFEAPSGPPSATPINPGGNQESTDPETGLTPSESAAMGNQVVGVASKVAGIGWNLSSNLIIIVIAILLLAIAAYSIVIPSSARGKIAERALFE